MAVDIASFTIKDATGDSKSIAVYFVHGGATLAQIVSYVQGLAGVVDAVTDGVLIAANLTVGVTLPGGIKTDVTGDPDIQRGALMGYTADGTPYKHSVWVPAFIDSGFTGDVVDDANAAVQAFNDYLITVLNGNHATDKFENDLTDFIAGVKSFRK